MSIRHKVEFWVIEMSLKRGRDKRAKAKQSFLVPWRKGMCAQETILNAGMGSWCYRVRNKHIRPKSLYDSNKWYKQMNRIIKNIGNDMRLSGVVDRSRYEA